MKQNNIHLNIEEKLPAELFAFLRSAGELAAQRGEGLYLVGGTVRDMMLGQTGQDIDLVVEGDATALASALCPQKPTIHRRFNTACLKWNGWRIDLATARSESYARPGALPHVVPGRLEDDLLRRDFSINAMAVSLRPEDFGQLSDPLKGSTDLEQGLIRVLHKKSFIDDATRIWRALRYEQRLGFTLEEKTLKLLKESARQLDNISGDRLRYELECILAEDGPEKVLGRAYELGVLASFHPALKGDKWLDNKFSQARRQEKTPSAVVYLCLLAYRLTKPEKEELIAKLRLPKALAKALRDTESIKENESLLAEENIKPSQIYRLLHNQSTSAITACLAATETAETRRHLELYLKKLRHVETALTGQDLKRMGITPGPAFSRILNGLKEANLDGFVTNRQDEEKLAAKLMITPAVKEVPH